MEFIKIARASFALVFFVIFSGCANRPAQIYNWGTYETQVYAHFKNAGSPEQQIAALEQTLQNSPAQPRLAPPGYHAHLGLLYGEVGRFDDMKKQFETEKLLFPEATPFMDFLLRKLNNKTVKP